MTSFYDLGLSEKVLQAVQEAGYKEPTPIQAQAIPSILERKDVLGIAQTGTGKTASFVLPMLTLLEKGRARARMPRTLILEPTRELAAQVEENFIKYGLHHRLNVALLVGGSSFEKQDQKLQRGADVLIATPGRLLDHVERGKLLLTALEIFVIDEADRMLDMGFIPDIERICKALPFTRQTLFFSATMAPEITTLTKSFLHNPIVVEVSRPSSTASTITQKLVASGDSAWEKRKILRHLLTAESAEMTNAIIFCNRKRDIGELCKSLARHGFSVGSLHGDMDQSSRTTTLANFKEGTLKYLVASDVAARGLDIPEVSHVFNYDVPLHSEDYVHRIGRTGRAGKLGKAFTIVTPKDKKYLAAIEELSKETLSWQENAGDATQEATPSMRVEPQKKAKAASSKNKATSKAIQQKGAEPLGKKDSCSPNTRVLSAHPSKSRNGPTLAEKAGPSKSTKKNKWPSVEDDAPLGFGKDIPHFMSIKIRP